MISKELFIIFIFASSAKACPSSSKATFKDYKGNIIIQSILDTIHALTSTQEGNTIL